MKTVLIFFISLNVAVVKAEPLSLPADIATVISVDGKYDAKYSNAVRERFIVRSALGGESSQTIVLEKYAPGKYGSEDKIITVRSFSVSGLPGIKDYLSDISKASVEAAYGCCHLDNIRKDGEVWTFNADHGANSFKCKTKEANKGEQTISCSK